MQGWPLGELVAPYFNNENNDTNNRSVWSWNSSPAMSQSPQINNIILADARLCERNLLIFFLDSPSRQSIMSHFLFAWRCSTPSSWTYIFYLLFSIWATHLMIVLWCNDSSNLDLYVSFLSCVFFGTLPRPKKVHDSWPINPVPVSLNFCSQCSDPQWSMHLRLLNKLHLTI